MATLTPAFRAASERLHKEHEALGQVLCGLDAALDHLVCYSEVYADLSAADEIRRLGRQLAEQIPGHCRREEISLLEPVSEVSPELGEFCTEMKSEHSDLLMRLGRFCAALKGFDRALLPSQVEGEDLSEVISHLKETGRELTLELRRHVAAEEQELGGFL